MCYQEMGDIDNAIGYLEEAVERMSSGASVFRSLGDCYLAKKRFRRAAKLYEKAVKAWPRDARSLNSLGHVYGILGENLEIAIVLAEESVSIDKDNGLYQARLGELYMKSGDYEKAVSTLIRASELGHPCEALLEAARSKGGE
jgi:tetratricopeptide (TPR) repeat protein